LKLNRQNVCEEDLTQVNPPPQEGDIYYSDFYSGKFNNITFYDAPSVNSEFWETHCMVSSDGSRMFFTSDRPGGYGGKDIYLSQRINETTWSSPVNLGPRINGPNDEDAPFVSIDNRMLYFATNGNRSMGGYDIMVCDLLEDGTWSEARNLGFPFNSTEDDLFYTTTIDGLRGFMTTSRKGGMGDKDIYEIQNDFLGVQNVAVFKGSIKTTDNSTLPEDFAINVRLTCDDCDRDTAWRSATVATFGNRVRQVPLSCFICVEDAAFFLSSSFSYRTSMLDKLPRLHVNMEDR
jgi:hypothetical protein